MCSFGGSNLQLFLSGIFLNMPYLVSIYKKCLAITLGIYIFYDHSNVYYINPTMILSSVIPSASAL